MIITDYYLFRCVRFLVNDAKFTYTEYKNTLLAICLLLLLLLWSQILDSGHSDYQWIFSWRRISHWIRQKTKNQFGTVVDSWAKEKEQRRCEHLFNSKHLKISCKPFQFVIALSILSTSSILLYEYFVFNLFWRFVYLLFLVNLLLKENSFLTDF